MMPRFLVLSRAENERRCAKGMSYTYRGYDTMPWTRRLRCWFRRETIVDQSELVERLSQSEDA